MIKKILIVDDNAEIREYLVNAIHAFIGADVAEIHVWECGDAPDAIKAIRESARPFDLVISDVEMPAGERSGLEVILASRERTEETTTILMSGLDPVTLEKAALSVKAHRYLHKPFSIHELVDAVQELLALVPTH